MNIHYIGAERVETGSYYRTYQKRGVRKDGTRPARTREGKEYPGGRNLRRAYKTLNARRNAYDWGGEHRAPGSMRG